MKVIVDFREDAKGFYIDLADQFSALAVNRLTGDLLLDEGDGDDRYNGALILQKSNPQFVIRPHSGKLRVWLEYGKDRNQHFIGESSATWAFAKWILSANQAMRGKQPLLPIEQGGLLKSRSRRCPLKTKRASGVFRHRSTKLLSQLVTNGR